MGIRMETEDKVGVCGNNQGEMMATLTSVMIVGVGRSDQIPCVF